MLKHIRLLVIFSITYLASQDVTAIKTLDWKLGIEYNFNFHTYRSDSIKHAPNSYDSLFAKIGIFYRPLRNFAMEFYTGIGMQYFKFNPTREVPALTQADKDKLQSMISDPQLLADIQNAIQTGNLEAIPDYIDFSSFNYDYLRTPTAYSVSSYVVPLEVRFSYLTSNNARIYLGASYNKGGIIDEVNIYLGAVLWYLDIKAGYVFYYSNQAHKNQRIQHNGGVPIVISVGINW